MHSGQFGGEDQQRTMFVQLSRKSKGVTFYDSPVYTKVPNSLKSLTKQRSKSWNLSCQELLWLYLKVIISPNTPHILKLDRAYQVYIILTDPIRMFLVIFGIFHPLTFLISYIFYLLVGLIAWAKTGFKDSLFTVVTFPLYSKYLTLCRFYAYFYWYKIKYNYIKNSYHTRVFKRKLLLEYGATLILFIFIWLLTLNIIVSNLSNLIPNNITNKSGSDTTMAPEEEVISYD